MFDLELDCRFCLAGVLLPLFEALPVKVILLQTGKSGRARGMGDG